MSIRITFPNATLAVCLVTVMACQPRNAGIRVAGYTVRCGEEANQVDSTRMSFSTRMPAADEHRRRTELQFSALHEVIGRFTCEKGTPPRELKELLSLGAPATTPSEFLRPKRELLIDVWGNPVEYAVTGATYILRSRGADGKRNSSDDLTSEGTLP